MKEKLLISVYTRSNSSIHGLGLWCLTPPSTIFLLCSGNNFIGGWNRNTERKPLTFRKSLSYAYYQVIYHISEAFLVSDVVDIVC